MLIIPQTTILDGEKLIEIYANIDKHKFNTGATNLLIFYCECYRNTINH